MNKRAILTITLLLALALPVAFLGRERFACDRGGSTRFPETRYSDAVLWFNWTPANRLFFVSGFLVGFKDGHESGCSRAHKILSEGNSANNPLSSELWSDCIKHKYRYSKGTQFYVDQITEFYRTYPQDCDVPLRILLFELADERSHTLEQIHNSGWQSEDPPRKKEDRP
jgi:hypothetical protein